MLVETYDYMRQEGQVLTCIVLPKSRFSSTLQPFWVVGISLNALLDISLASSLFQLILYVASASRSGSLLTV
uniref:Uncharacterized protein n=1 Tax=Anguilla anguilla TaxID=7936 RepID=A0A0E9RDJ6_ANGAN